MAAAEHRNFSMADPKAATLQSEIVAFLSAGASYGAPGGAA